MPGAGGDGLWRVGEVISPPNGRVDKCPPILEKEKDIELEIDREIEGGEIALAVLGRYQNVFLSAGELSELQNDFPEPPAGGLCTCGNE